MRRLAPFAALALAGCSLLTDLDGFTSPAASTKDDGGGAGAEAGTPPGAVTDAGADTGPTTADGAPAPLCAGTHVFCTDFDEAEPAREWNDVHPGKGGIARDQGEAASQPFSLLVTHPATNIGDTPWAVKTVPVTAPKGLHCRFKYRRAEVDKDGVLVLFMIDFNTATDEHFFAEIKDGFTTGRVYLNAKSASGEEHDDFPEVPTVSTTRQEWADVDWVLDFTPGKVRSTLRSGDQMIDDRPAPSFDPARVTSVKLSLGLGDFAAPTGTWSVRYDDFVCDAL